MCDFCDEVKREIEKIKEDFCYKIDVDLYLPVKKELAGIDRTYSLGMRKEELKGYLCDTLDRFRKEVLKI